MCLQPFQVFHVIMRKIASTEDVKYVVRHRSLKKVKLEACGSIPHPQAPADGQMPGFCRGMLRFRIGRRQRLPATNRLDIWKVKVLAENSF